MPKLIPIYKKLDATIEQQLQKCQQKAQCSAGCGFCCRTQQILVCNEEIHEIVDFLEKPSNSCIKTEVVNNATNTIETINKVNNLPSIPCVFLSQSNNCLIRDVRPFVCRFYFSSNMEQCRLLDQQGYTTKSGYAAWTTPIRKTCLLTMAANCDMNAPMYEINSIIHHIYHIASSSEYSAWLNGHPPKVLQLVKLNLGQE